MNTEYKNLRFTNTAFEEWFNKNHKHGGPSSSSEFLNLYELKRLLCKEAFSAGIEHAVDKIKKSER